MGSPKSLVIQLRPSDRNLLIKGKYGNLNPEGKKFLLVYVHCDAFASKLIERNYTYQEALNFVMEGDRSNLNEGTAYCDPDHAKYLNHDYETWEGNQPDATDDPYPFDCGSLLLMIRSDDPDEDVTVLEWDNEEEDYMLAE